eukprot:s1076_g6.t1
MHASFVALGSQTAWKATPLALRNKSVAMGYGGGGGKGGKGRGKGGKSSKDGKDGKNGDESSWDAAQSSGKIKLTLEDLTRVHPQRTVEAFPHLTVAADWPESRAPRSGSAFYLPLIWTALLPPEGSEGSPSCFDQSVQQLNSLGDEKHFKSARRASLLDVWQAQVYWRQIFSGWDDWVTRLRVAMAAFEGPEGCGIEGLVKSHVQRVSVTAGALVYGDLEILGALPHISNARKSPDQDAILELDLALQMEIEASVATLFLPAFPRDALEEGLIAGTLAAWALLTWRLFDDTKTGLIAQEVAGLPVSNSEECVQTLQLNVSLPSGQCAALSLPLGATVLDLKTAAEQSLEQAFLRLAAPDGRFLDPTESLRASGLQSGDHVTAVAQQVKVSATDGAMVLWSVGGDQVIASGDARRGGCTAAVQDQLRSVQKIQATAGAFAAMLATGSVVTWGSPDEGGDSTEVKDQLLNVQQIHATRSAFAAILADGRVVTWGCPGSGGVGTALKSRISSGMCSRFTPHALLLLLFWQMVMTALGGTLIEIFLINAPWWDLYAYTQADWFGVDSWTADGKGMELRSVGALRLVCHSL